MLQHHAAALQPHDHHRNSHHTADMYPRLLRGEIGVLTVTSSRSVSPSLAAYDAGRGGVGGGIRGTPLAADDSSSPGCEAADV